jgi:cation:H+ antiporter
MIWLLVATAVTLLPFYTGSYGALFGGVMVAALVVFVCWLVRRERRARPAREHHEPTNRSAGQVALHIVMVPIGLVGLVYGGEWLVSSAVEIAEELGWSEAVIGATIVAIGTSLPELATAIMAARKGHSELVLGNIIGSNIFNILMVIGVTGTIIPLPVTWSEQGMRTVFGLGLSVLLAIVLLGPKRLPRSLGAVLLASYVVYLLLEVYR